MKILSNLLKGIGAFSIAMTVLRLWRIGIPRLEGPEGATWSGVIIILTPYIIMGLLSYGIFWFGQFLGRRSSAKKRIKHVRELQSINISESLNNFETIIIAAKNEKDWLRDRAIKNQIHKEDLKLSLGLFCLAVVILLLGILLEWLEWPSEFIAGFVTFIGSFIFLFFLYTLVQSLFMPNLRTQQKSMEFFLSEILKTNLANYTRLWACMTSYAHDKFKTPSKLVGYWIEVLKKLKNLTSKVLLKQKLETSSLSYKVKKGKIYLKKTVDNVSIVNYTIKIEASSFDESTNSNLYQGYVMFSADARLIRVGKNWYINDVTVDIPGL